MANGKSFYQQHKAAVVVGSVGLGALAFWFFKSRSALATGSGSSSSSSSSIQKATSIPLTTNSAGQTVSSPTAPTPLDNGAVTSDTNQTMGDAPPPADDS